MSIGKIVTILGFGILLGLVAGLITRNLFVGFAFPFLLFAFYMIWRSYKRDIEIGVIKVDEKEDKSQEVKAPTTYNRPPEV